MKNPKHQSKNANANADPNLFKHLYFVIIVVFCIFTQYSKKMIKTIKSKALRLLWEKDNSSKLPPSQIKKIRNFLTFIITQNFKIKLNKNTINDVWWEKCQNSKK